MKTIVTTAFLTLGLVVISGVQTATAGSLNALSSACRTGDYAACSRYNAEVIARSTAQGPALTQGYDPFAIVPATHSTRTPSQPKANNADIAVGKSAPDHSETKKTQ